ncbi:MAG TPA: DUF29 domain-containing protein [Bryobacteraceae bacterium]|jgi:hypothetical protein|nr:DUF29 domain-containing protein [Bryobacteraceae bacterium]
MQSQLDKTAADPAGLYDEDFFEWTRVNGELLRAGHYNQADIEHIAEEIEDMGKRDLKELNNRLQVLVEHLLKWQLQPARRSRSWISAIATQRIKIEDDLKQSPSLKSMVANELRDNYTKAVRRTVAETGLRSDIFPAECPFTVEQILDPEFLP